jgi:hypothetical protein
LYRYAQNKLRQDGDDGVEAAAGGDFEETGEKLSTLLTGVATGNVGSILNGAASFIGTGPDDGTRKGVISIFGAITPALNKGFQSVLDRTKTFLGITSTTAVPAVVTDLRTVETATSKASVVPAKPVEVEEPVVSKATAPAPAVVAASSGDDDDEESDIVKKS